MPEGLPQGPGVYVVGGRRYQLNGPPDAATVAKLEAHAQQAPPPGAVAGEAMGKAVSAPGRPPGALTQALSMAGQIGVPALAAAKMGMRNPFGLAATGIAAGLAPHLLRGGTEGAMNAAPGVVASEVLPTLANKVAGDIVKPAAQGLLASKAAEDLARGVGGVMDRVYPARVAGRVLQRANQVLAKADPYTRQVLRGSLDKHGLNITKLDGPGFLQLLKTSPETVANAVTEFKAAGGPTLMTPKGLQRLWVNAQISRASARDSVSKLPGLHMDSGGKVLLDGTRIGEAWNALTHEGRAAFGDAGKSIDAFASEMAKLKKAGKGIQQLAGTAESPGFLNMAPFLSAASRLSQAIKNPMNAMLAGGAGTVTALEAGPAAMRMVGSHPEMAGATAGAHVVNTLGKKAVHRITENLLSSDVGLKWLTQGARMMAQATPPIIVADALFRTAGRSPELMQVLSGEQAPEQ